ncbi:hypothetical protein [Caenimonas koreensis]|uniref:hypothetical protein n=1 Tax=Caenimonas koreensis TaxID=367474 RepID=UPI003782F520
MQALRKWAGEHDAFHAIGVEGAIKQAIAAQPDIKHIHVVYPHPAGISALGRTLLETYGITVTAVASPDELPAPAYVAEMEPAVEPPGYIDAPQPPPGAAPLEVNFPHPAARQAVVAVPDFAGAPPPRVDPQPQLRQPLQQPMPVYRSIVDCAPPSALERLLTPCLTDFRNGLAQTRAGQHALEQRLREVIHAISRLDDELVKVNSLSILHYGLCQFPEGNSNASQRFAGTIFRSHLRPAVEATNPAIRTFVMMREDLLRKMDPANDHRR